MVLIGDILLRVKQNLVNILLISYVIEIVPIRGFPDGDICKTTDFSKSSIVNIFCIFPQFCTSEVFICENYTRIFEFFGILLSKCPSIRGKRVYVSLHNLPISPRHELKIYFSSV